MAKIGIVYATNSLIVRRIIVPTHDDRELDAHKAGQGETMLIVDKKLGYSLPDAHAHIRKATGREPPSPRCAVVDKSGKVVGVINADPELDSIDGHDLILHESAEIGWRRDKREGLIVSDHDR